MSVAVFLCPSDINKDKKTPFPPFTGLNAVASVTSYGVNEGDWFIWNGFNGPDNRGAFGPNRSRRIADFTDGTSQTLFATDVKVYQPLCRFPSFTNVNSPVVIYDPTLTRTSWPLSTLRRATRDRRTRSGRTATPTRPQ